MAKKTRHKTNNSKEKKHKTKDWEIQTKCFYIGISVIYWLVVMCSELAFSNCKSYSIGILCLQSFDYFFCAMWQSDQSCLFSTVFFFICFPVIIPGLKRIEHSLTCPTSTHSMCSYRIRYFSCCWHIIFGFCLLHCVCT